MTTCWQCALLLVCICGLPDCKGALGKGCKDVLEKGPAEMKQASFKSHLLVARKLLLIMLWPHNAISDNVYTALGKAVQCMFSALSCECIH